MAIENSITTSWNQLNSLLGKPVYSIEKFDWKNPDVFRRFAQKKYLLSPEEVVRFEVSTSAGPGKKSYRPDPRGLDPLKARNEYLSPNYWFVNAPFWAGSDQITLIERVSLNRNIPKPFGYIHQLGEFSQTPVIFYEMEFHGGVGATCGKTESLLERLSEVGIETVSTSLTP